MMVALSRLRGLPTVTTAALMIVCGYAVWELAATLSEDAASPDKVTPVSRGSSTTQAPATNSRQSPSSGSQLKERPLFDRSRRPIPPSPPAPQVVAVSSPRIEPPPPLPAVIGTMLSSDGRVAVVRTVAPEGLVYAVVGTMVGGWRVLSVRDDRVELEYHDTRRELALFPTSSIGAGVNRGTLPTIPGAPSGARP